MGAAALASLAFATVGLPTAEAADEPAPTRVTDETPDAAGQPRELESPATGVEEPPAGPGEAAEQEDAAESPPPPGHWAPPPPSAKEFDWMQMSSGEWLKGELERLRDYRVAFDSDEFDELEVDWDDVAAFYLPRPHGYRVAGRVLFGTAELRGDVLRIRTADKVEEFKRSELSSIARGGGRELDYWSAKATLSLTARRGNTKQADLTGSSEVRRETAVTRFVTQYAGAFSRVGGKKQANNHRVNTQLDVFLTRTFYLTVPFGEFYTDEFQNIDARVTSGLGVGNEFVRNGMVELDASIGGAHQYTRLSAGTSQKRDSHDFAVVTGVSLDLDLTSDIELDNSYALQLVVTDFGNTNHHAESVLSFDVWGPLDFDVSGIWDRIEDPAPDSNGGDRPKRDDFRLLVGVSLDF